jgi:hypothetical protein
MGRSSNASSVIWTRRERPLVTSRAERSPTAAPATPAATSVAASAPVRRMTRVRRSLPATAIAKVTANSATKLDWE